MNAPMVGSWSIEVKAVKPFTIHGDLLTVNGPKRVAVWDHKDHDGKGYYYLTTGDTLNTATRVPTFSTHAAGN